MPQGAIERYSGDPVSASTYDDALSEFCNLSYSIHEDVPSSLESRSSFWTQSHDETGFWDERMDDSMVKQSKKKSAKILHSPAPMSEHVSDIEEIPNVAYLGLISPRIMKANFIVAVLTVCPRRRVRTRWGHDMDIVEVVVGDETRSGFRVTCWLTPENQGAKTHIPKRNALSESVAILRPRDVVLFRSVALSTFKGQVYGQSVGNNVTQIELLYRKPIDSSDIRGVFTSAAVTYDADDDPNPQLMKVRRVSDWLQNFVEPEVHPNADDPLVRSDQHGMRPLPPDTQ
jgi:hypothetical protein